MTDPARSASSGLVRQRVAHCYGCNLTWVRPVDCECHCYLCSLKTASVTIASTPPNEWILTTFALPILQIQSLCISTVANTHRSWELMAAQARIRYFC